jgi:hypothetical protein
MRRLIIFSVIVWALVFTTNAQASGVAVKPSKIEISSAIGQSASASFLVINIDSAPALYVIKAESFSRLISIKPDSFQLEPGENRLVTVEAISVLPYVFDTNISIVSKALAADSLSASAGVKLPIAVKIILSPWQLGIVLTLLVLFSLVFWRRKKGKKPEDKSA